MQAKQIKKLYYSIGEVSNLTELKQYVLRYWETEFPHLKPNKNSAGNRIYRQNDIDNLIEIKKSHLVEGILSYRESERPDLNWRPPDPQSGALPDYATSRKISLLTGLHS